MLEYNDEEYSCVAAQVKNERIYCHCVFEFKNELKKLGFKWDPINKLWYIEKNKFTEDVFNRSMKVRFANRTTIGLLKYYYVFYKRLDELADLKENVAEKIQKKPVKRLF